MQRTAAVILGHSHLSSVVNHLADRPGEVGHHEPAIEYYVFDTMRLGSDFQFSVPDESTGFVLNPRIRQMVDERLSNRKLIWISMFGGNAHNALTLLEHPRPFDFILPENTKLERISDAEILPASYVQRFLARMAEPYLLNKTCLRQSTIEEIFHMESPPPNGDDNYILEHLENYFREQAKQPRIAPRILRYKLWRMHSELIRSACVANGIEFVEAPKESVDADGFLVPAAYSGDSTHAGPWYGGRILRQVESRVQLPYGGWSWLY